MLTVGYEQARGLREVHEKTDGFSANKSRTFPFAVEELYAAWADEERRVEWIGSSRHVLRTATAPKSMRISWRRTAPRWTSTSPQRRTARAACRCSRTSSPIPRRSATAKEFWTKAFDRLEAELAEPAGPAD